jgi:hypothetical protein
MPDSRPRNPGRAAARLMVRVVDSGENRRSRPGNGVRVVRLGQFEY